MYTEKRSYSLNDADVSVSGLKCSCFRCPSCMDRSFFFVQREAGSTNQVWYERLVESVPKGSEGVRNQSASRAVVTTRVGMLLPECKSRSAGAGS